ncbi:KPN_02809 family neutral zinc metallopeptidase [Phycicoccus duodecadis]|uniref:Neutral zinc metallopeptidase n=1 Tax=Phycicoccus duodecadis TaxID=173053 RepID=A0A2N3YEJ8_9MICO|nr:neutral zinc metallopeptidase [Phycicoccus duodecadis]PKW25274.1 hypothetical protein ATL31_0060 [Phycicoccus duodecadis]
MSFNENARLDTSQVSGGGGGGGAPGGLVVGGGLGGIIITILLLVFGIDPSSIPTGGGTSDPGQVQAGGSTDSSAFSDCRTGADANARVECRVVGTVNSVQAFWAGELKSSKYQWQETRTVLYSGQTQSACGTASNEVGPFYCPLDKKVYIDASFFDLLTSRFGADDGALAQEYVVAHEYGHALQDQLGLLNRAQQDPQGAESGSVRTELMADCLAGVWAQHASTVPDAGGTPFLKPLTDTDIQSALSAAAAVGDDTIQKAATGRVTPESWTHGSSKSRQTWFLTGYKSGDLNRCDTFSVPSVES